MQEILKEVFRKKENDVGWKLDSTLKKGKALEKELNFFIFSLLIDLTGNGLFKVLIATIYWVISD